MKKKMMQYLAAITAAFTLTLPTLAVEPTAVWTDFKGLDSADLVNGGVTLKLNEVEGENGNTVSDGVVTIGNNGGIHATWGASTTLNTNGKITVLVQYSDLSLPASGYAPIGDYSNLNANSTNVCGISVSNAGKLNGVWQGRYWTTAQTVQATITATGSDKKYMAFEYDTITTTGTEFYMSDNGLAYTQMYAASGLRASSSNASSYRPVAATIGGVCADSAGTGDNTFAAKTVAGMKIYKLAIFAGKLTAAELAAYIFPGDVKNIAAIGTIKASEINEQADGVGRAVVTWSGDDAELELDETLDCTRIDLICDGDLMVVGNKPSGTESAKFNVDGVNGEIVRDWDVDMASIGVNFHSGSGSDTSLAMITGSTWYHVANASGTNTEIFGDGLSTVTWSSANTYNYSSGTFLNGYLDDGNPSPCAQVTVTHIPWGTYDVIVYAATDTENAKFQPVTINGTQYTAGEGGIAVEGSDIWGASRNATGELGTNAIRLNGVTASTLTIVGGSRSGSTARGGIAAIQVLKSVGVHDIVAEGSIRVSEINDDISQDDMVNLTIPAGESIIFDTNPIFSVLNVTAGGALTITSDGHTITAADVAKVSLNGVTALTLNNATALATGTPTYPVTITGTEALTTFPYKTAVLTEDLTIASPVNETEVGNLVGNKKNVIFEEGFSMNTARWNLGNSGGVTQTYTQNAGEITLTKTTTGNNTDRPLVLGHWSSTVNYALNGGSITVPNGRVMFGWDGTIAMTVGGGEDTAFFSALGFNSDRSNTASLTIKENGTVSFGADGMILTSGKAVTLAGGQLEAYDTAVLSLAHADGLKVTADSVLCTNGEGEDPITLTVSNKVTIAEGATLCLGGNVEVVGDITTAEGAYLDLSAVDTFDFGTRRPALAGMPGTIAKFTLTDVEFAVGELSFKVNVGDNLEEITTNQVMVCKQDGVEATWAETNPITIADGVATFKFQTTKPITEATNVSDLDPDLTGMVVVKGAETAEDAFTVTFDAALPEGVTELRVTGHAKLTVGGDITTLPAAKIALGDNANVTIDRPFDTDFTIPEGTVLNLVGGDDLAGRKDYNLFTVNGTLTTSGYCNLNNTTTVGTTGELIVKTDALTYKGGDQSMKGTLTVKSGTELNGCTGDMLNYSAACRVNVYGTIDLGSKRWSCADDTKIFLYNGGLIKGTGDGYGMLDYFENNGRLVASGTCEIAGPIRLRHSDHTTKICTCRDTTLTISGVIKEKGNLEKTYATVAEGNSADNSGNAYTWLTGANTFTGSLTHIQNSGSLCFASTTSFAEGTTITLGSGTALQLGDATHTGSLTLSNAIVNGSRIDVYLDANLTGTISGTGAINVKNGGSLVKADTLASTGTKTVEAGGALVIPGEIDWSAISFDGWTINGYVGLGDESSFITDATLDKSVKVISGATTTIPDGITVTALAGADTFVGPGSIAGTGTLVIDRNSTAKTGNGLLSIGGLQGEAWTGTLWLKNFAWNDWNFGELGRANGGKVKLTGVTGYAPASTDAGCAAEIILADDGTAKALTVNNGYSTTGGKTCLYTFYKLSGSGTIQTSKPAKGDPAPQFRFNDISGFSGTFGSLNKFCFAVGTGTTTTDSSKVTFDDGITIPAGLTVTSPKFGSTITFTSDEELVAGSTVMTYAGTAPTLNGVTANDSYALTLDGNAIKLATSFTEPSLTVGEITYEAGKDFVGGKVTVNVSNVDLGNATGLEAVLYYASGDQWVKAGSKTITTGTTSVTFEDTSADHIPAGSMPQYKVAFAYTAAGLENPVVFKGADDEYTDYGKNFNTITGWIDEDGDTKFGTTGTWEGYASHSADGIVIAKEVGDYATFAPSNTMNGSSASIITEVSFAAADTLAELNAETDKPAQTGVTIVQDGETNKFAYYNPTEGVWTNFLFGTAVELETSYKVVVGLNYAAHSGTIVIYEDADEVSLIDLVSFDLPESATTFTGMDFTGDGTIASIEGEYYDANLASVNGTEYATLQAAINAAEGTDYDIVLLTENVTVPEGWIIEDGKLVKEQTGILIYLSFASGETFADTLVSNQTTGATWTIKAEDQFMITLDGSVGDVFSFVTVANGMTMPVFTLTYQQDYEAAVTIESITYGNYEVTLEDSTAAFFTVAATEAASSDADDEVVQEAIVESVTEPAEGMSLEETKTAVAEQVETLTESGATPQEVAGWIKDSGFTGGAIAVAQDIETSYNLQTQLFTEEPVAEVTSIETSEGEVTEGNVGYDLTFEIKNGAEGEAVTPGTAETVKNYIKTMVQANTSLDFGETTKITVEPTIAIDGTAIKATVELPQDKSAAFMKIEK